MITRDQFIATHWNQYLVCESDFILLSEYVDLRDSNMKTSSNRIAVLLLTVCTLIDSTLREMLSKSQDAGLSDLAKALVQESCYQSDIEVLVLRATKSRGALKPWEWLSVGAGVTIPSWWTAYNNIKHDRFRHYDEGNLGNLLNAMAALYCLELFYVKKIGDYWLGKLGNPKDESTWDVPNDISHVFAAENWSTRKHVSGYETYAITNEDIDEMFRWDD